MPKSFFNQMALSGETYNEVVQTSGGEECSRNSCRNRDIEWHHIAPKEVFGWEEADEWPVVPLCQEHHREWHRRMIGYRLPEFVAYIAAHDGDDGV